MNRLGYSQRGFTLLEAIVALAILGMSLGLLYRVVGGATRTVGEARQYSRAAIVAESVLQLRDAVPPGGWVESGRSAEFVWQVSSFAFEPVTGRIPLYKVEIDVSWLDGPKKRVFSLTTLRPEEGARGRGGQ